jgi:hypothetical protein
MGLQRPPSSADAPLVGALATVAALVASTLPAAVARAEAATAVLRVDRSADASVCEDAADLAVRINRIAARDAIVQGAPAPVTLDVSFAKSGGKLRARVAVSGASHGERELDDDGPDCGALAEAVAVSVALLLDEAPTSPRAPEPRRPSKPSKVPPSRPPLPHMMLDIAALESVGVVGPGTIGLFGGVEVRVTRYLTLGAGALGILDDTERFGAGNLRVDLVAVRAPACFAVQAADRSVGAELCGYPALGTMIGSGEGFVENHTVTQPWFAMGASAIGTGPIVGPLAFTGRVDLLVPIVRPSFVVEDLGGAPTRETGVAFETPPVGVAAGFGLRALIP